MKTLWILGIAVGLAAAGCAAPQQTATVNDTAVMGASEAPPSEGAAIAESLGFHGPRRDVAPAR